jgi:hypothetical protein
MFAPSRDDVLAASASLYVFSFVGPEEDINCFPTNSHCHKAQYQSLFHPQVHTGHPSSHKCSLVLRFRVMDVTRETFPDLLPKILEDITNAHFIALDLEFSGVPLPSSPNVGLATLQERYESVKAAAEKYQILQIGLTCVVEDTSTSSYVVRPYNIALNPLLVERFMIKRESTFSSPAVNFLLRHQFSIQTPFEHGVPYLSRDDAAEAERKEMEKYDHLRLLNTVFRPLTSQAHEFVTRVCRQIHTWMNGSPRVRRVVLYFSFLSILSFMLLNLFPVRIQHI